VLEQPCANPFSTSAVASCTAITISGITVPAGTTLDLTKVKTGTTITFTGTTTFAYKEWAGPLISVAGTNIKVTGTGTLDGLGAQYWDGEGSNGGKTKPKFFYAHKMINSVIEKIKILNSPVQVFSVNGASYLTINGVTVDNSAGEPFVFSSSGCRPQFFDRHFSRPQH
jgi:polygalacturonase